MKKRVESPERRGGARQGSGRKAEGLALLSIRLSQQSAEKIRRGAKKKGFSQGKFIEEIFLEKQYSMKPAEESSAWWTVKDTLNDISVTFAEGLFDEMRRVETNDLDKEEQEELPSHLSCLETWVKKNHIDIAVCNRDAMKEAVNALTHEGHWILLADALNGHMRNPAISATAELSAEAEDYLSGGRDDGLSEKYDISREAFLAAIHSLSDAAAQEVFRAVAAFWHSDRYIKRWADDITYWPAIPLEGGEDIDENF